MVATEAKGQSTKTATNHEDDESDRPRKKKKVKRGDAGALAPPVEPRAPSRWAWLSKAVVVALLFGLGAGGTGGYFLGRWSAAPNQRPIPGPAFVALPEWSPRQGPPHAKVTIVEFSDFQCPFCARAVPTIKQILAEYKDSVAVVFRNKALPMHKDARGAALALQAAQRQGKAWEMHDKMFENAKDLARPALEGYAQELGLDVEKFRADLDDPRVAAEVDADDKAADEVQANGTPCFFVNGRRIPGARPFSDFKRVIDEEIEKADKLIASGTPIAEVYEKLAKAQKSN
jgi:protein-disulfide isomerase